MHAFVTGVQDTLVWRVREITRWFYFGCNNYVNMRATTVVVNVKNGKANWQGALVFWHESRAHETTENP